MDPELLLQPFQYDFMRKAFLIALIIALPTALLSCFLVVRGWALLGDAISHAVLPGIVLAYLLGLPLALGAFAAGLTCAVSAGYLSDHCRLRPDTVMGVVFSGLFATGIVLYAAVETEAHLDHILFGNMLGIETSDLATAGSIAVLICLGIALKWKDLMLHSFDPAQIHVAGLSGRAMHYALLAAISLTVVSTLAASGLILAIGLMIAPGAIAFLSTRTFGRMLWISVLVCAGAMVVGTYASFFLDSAPAPTVVLVLTLLFVLAFARRRLQLRRRARGDRTIIRTFGPQVGD